MFSYSYIITLTIEDCLEEIEKYRKDNIRLIRFINGISDMIYSEVDSDVDPNNGDYWEGISSIVEDKTSCHYRMIEENNNCIELLKFRINELKILNENKKGD